MKNRTVKYTKTELLLITATLFFNLFTMGPQESCIVLDQQMLFGISVRFNGDIYKLKICDSITLGQIAELTLKQSFSDNNLDIDDCAIQEMAKDHSLWVCFQNGTCYRPSRDLRLNQLPGYKNLEFVLY